MKGKVWVYTSLHGAGNWYFINLSRKVSLEIEANKGIDRGRFGSIPVAVGIGNTSWKTSIFADKKAGVYILPLKSEVRKKEGISHGDTIVFSIDISF